MRKLTLLWILLFFSQIFAQDKPIALKFDEFSSFPNQISSPLIDRGNRLAKQFLKEPGMSKAIIIFYNQRKDKFPLTKGQEWADYTTGIMVNGYNIAKDRVIMINGGYREYATLEYWIVPANAVFPTPSPTMSKNEIVICPDINVAGDGFRKDRTEPLKFSVAFNGQEPNSKLGLEWNVSAGKIVKGQGTNQIEVDLTDSNSKLISASVQVKGLNPECNNHSFASTQFGSYPLKIDETGRFVPSDFSARLQNLNLYIQSDLRITGYIIIYGSRDDYKKDVLRATKYINQSFEFLQYNRDRIKVIDGGYREEMTIEYFVVPDGVEPPKPNPTVDEKFIVPPKKVVKKRKKTSK